MARRAATAKITHGGTTAWSAGDRIGKTFGSHLRELRVRACMGHEIDRDSYVAMIDLHENVLDSIAEAGDELTESDIPIEEAPDAIDALVKLIAELRTKLDEQEQEADKRYDGLVSEQATVSKEHETELSDAFKTCDEMRKRAELAEHERDELQRMLTAMRAERPALRKRGSR